MTFGGFLTAVIPFWVTRRLVLYVRDLSC
jgi:hypothetical protein